MVSLLLALLLPDTFSCPKARLHQPSVPGLFLPSDFAPEFPKDKKSSLSCSTGKSGAISVTTKTGPVTNQKQFPLRCTQHRTKFWESAGTAVSHRPPQWPLICSRSQCSARLHREKQHREKAASGDSMPFCATELFGENIHHSQTALPTQTQRWRRNSSPPGCYSVINTEINNDPP